MELISATVLEIPNDYLDFHQHVFHDRKTPIVCVYSKHSGDKLAEIRWFGRWRGFAFFPEPGTVWSPDCLEAINYVIEDLHANRKAGADE